MRSLNSIDSKDVSRVEAKGNIVVPHCSSCGQDLESDFGIVTCSHCGEQNILGFEKNNLPDQDFQNSNSPSPGDVQPPLQTEFFDNSEREVFSDKEASSSMNQPIWSHEKSVKETDNIFLSDKQGDSFQPDFVGEGPSQSVAVESSSFASDVPFSSLKEDKLQDNFFLNQDQIIKKDENSNEDKLQNEIKDADLKRESHHHNIFENSNQSQPLVEESLHENIQSFVKSSPSDIPRYPFGIKVFDVNLVAERKKLEEALMANGLLKSEFFPSPFLGEVNVFPLSSFDVVVLVRLLNKINFRYEVYEKRD